MFRTAVGCPDLFPVANVAAYIVLSTYTYVSSFQQAKNARLRSNLLVCGTARQRPVSPLVLRTLLVMFNHASLISVSHVRGTHGYLVWNMG